MRNCGAIRTKNSLKSEPLVTRSVTLTQQQFGHGMAVAA